MIPRVSKKWTSSDSNRSSCDSRSSRQSDASTVTPVSSERMTMRSSARDSTRARARRLIAALSVWAPRMKEIQRPDVDCAAREIDSRRALKFR